MPLANRNELKNHTSRPVSFILNLSYLQKYFLIFLLFCLSLAPISYLVISFYRAKSNFLDKEIWGNNYIKPIRTLLELISQHQLQMYRYYHGNTDLKASIHELQAQINDTLQILAVKENENEYLANISSASIQTKPIVNSDELKKKWNTLNKQAFNINAKTSDKLHQRIIEDLQNHISHIQDTYFLITDYELSTYYLIKSNLTKIPATQILLNEIIRNAIDVIIDKSFTQKQRDDFLIKYHFIEFNLKSIKENTKKAFAYGSRLGQNTTLESQISLALNEYSVNVESFLNTLNNQLYKEQEITLSQSELIAIANTGLAAGFSLWDTMFDAINDLLLSRKSEITKKFWTYIGLSLGLLLFAFVIGTLIIYSTTKRLKEITKATNRFANGDFTVHIPVLYHDEVGVLGNSFNLMTRKIEELLNQLYQLLEATKALANGDLSARITSTNSDSDFGKITFAFNSMAESFENIILKLQQIGLNLTTSATDIASAAKQQETITIEQEATTREISIAASEISSTAKEFANTMNDVSVVAEQTSTLAVSGKDALNNMENVMRQMVDASGNIAVKLAVLNEKAGNITSFITTISKVADQTNLLSLNASIEAEKAGEYGRSFAVIAREIRRLADQTAVATLDIEKMVNEIMTAVSSSVMGVDDFTQEIRDGVNQVKKVSEQLAEIIEQVQMLTVRFESVNQGMQAQSTGAEQINEAIAQLSQTAQQTTESIQQFHKTIQELNIAAQELRSVAPHVTKLLKTY